MARAVQAASEGEAKNRLVDSLRIKCRRIAGVNGDLVAPRCCAQEPSGMRMVAIAKVH